MIIFLYGEDNFRSNQKALALKEKFLKSDQSGSGLSIFDFEEKKTSKEFLDALSMGNLLSSKRLVVAKNLIANGLKDCQVEALQFFKKNAQSIGEDADLVLVFWEGNAPAKNNAFYKFLESGNFGIKKQNFEKLSGIKIAQFIQNKIKESGSEISQAALNKLVLYAGNDMHILDKEIEKLINFSGKEIINEPDVELLVRANLDSNIFDTIDALAGNDKKKALTLLHRHLEKGEDPFYMFSMFIYQFRNLLKVADLAENFGANEYEIAKKAKLHPFVVKKSLAQIRNFNLEKLKKIYGILGNLDLKIKTGQIDINLALDKFIAEL